MKDDLILDALMALYQIETIIKLLKQSQDVPTQEIGDLLDDFCQRAQDYLNKADLAG